MHLSLNKEHLEKTRSPFQILVHNIFKKQIGKNVEVYVDDILERSKRVEDHWSYLQETFLNLMKANLKLKVDICTFGILEGKFLGYMIIKEGIKPHLEKVQAIINMEPPKMVKELQKLNSGVAALRM